jgi:hypothetical protein
MTPHERGKVLRQAVNYSIANNIVYYNCVDEKKNLWEAEVSTKPLIKYFSTNEAAGSTKSMIGLEVMFTPGELDYSCPVYNYAVYYPVDFKSYRWACRKLAEFQVLQKLGA